MSSLTPIFCVPNKKKTAQVVRMFTTREAEKERQIKGAVPFKNVLVSTMCSSIKQIIPWK